MKTVVLIACSKKYRDKTFYAQAAWDDANGVWITGQEKLTPEELKNEPFIINPDEQYPIMHNSRLRICTEPGEKRGRDDVLYKFYIEGVAEISPDAPSVNRAIHEFYIHDLEEISKKSVTAVNKSFEAMKLLAEDTTFTRMRDIAIYMESQHANSTPVILEAAIKEACINTPDLILDFFKPENEARLFVLKLLNAGYLVKRTGNKIYTKTGTFIGDSVMDAVNFLTSNKEENAAIASSLATQLRDNDERVVSVQTEAPKNANFKKK